MHYYTLHKLFTCFLCNLYGRISPYWMLNDLNVKPKFEWDLTNQNWPTKTKVVNINTLIIKLIIYHLFLTFTFNFVWGGRRGGEGDNYLSLGMEEKQHLFFCLFGVKVEVNSFHHFHIIYYISITQSYEYCIYLVWVWFMING